MSPLRWHPPYLVDNTDTQRLRDRHREQTVGFFKFLLFCAHQFIYVSFSLCVFESVCNPTQVLKNRC